MNDKPSDDTSALDTFGISPATPALGIVSTVVTLESEMLLPADLKLRRASLEEVPRVKEVLRQHLFLRPPVEAYYESLWEPNPSGGHTGHVAPPEHWKYHVVEMCQMAQPALCAVRDATTLTDVPLRINFLLLPNDGLMFFGRSYDVDEWVYGETPHLTEAWAEEVHLVHQQIAEAPPEIARSVEMFQQVRNADSLSPLYVLGLFGVLESLLTHDPRGEYDSLSHQIRTKMKLLQSRFRQPLQYERFGAVAPEKIWNKLYKLRSCIAHGGVADWRGELSILRNQREACAFLTTAVRRTIRQALTEPRLVLDLQCC